MFRAAEATVCEPYAIKVDRSYQDYKFMVRSIYSLDWSIPSIPAASHPPNFIIDELPL